MYGIQIKSFMVIVILTLFNLFYLELYKADLVFTSSLVNL